VVCGSRLRGWPCSRRTATLAIVPVQTLQPGDPRRIGPFVIQGRIGHGGMGDVYLGRWNRGELVAVKLLRADLTFDAQFRARFRREVEVALRVRGLCTASDGYTRYPNWTRVKYRGTKVRQRRARGRSRSRAARPAASARATAITRMPWTDGKRKMASSRPPSAARNRRPVAPCVQVFHRAT
jgi:hypothetical protein